MFNGLWILSHYTLAGRGTAPTTNKGIRWAAWGNQVSITKLKLQQINNLQRFIQEQI